jgi:hypothetical protein
METLIIIGLIILVIYLLSRNETEKESFNGTNSRKTSSYHHKNYQFNEDSPRAPKDPIITKVVGVTFENRQIIIKQLHIGEMLELVQEPENPYDPNAVKVISRSGEDIGYLNKRLAEEVQWYFDASWLSRYAEILDIIGDSSEGQNIGVVIKIYPPSLEEALFTDHLRYPRF